MVTISIKSTFLSNTHFNVVLINKKWWPPNHKSSFVSCLWNENQLKELFHQKATISIYLYFICIALFCDRKAKRFTLVPKVLLDFLPHWNITLHKQNWEIESVTVCIFIIFMFLDHSSGSHRFFRSNAQWGKILKLSLVFIAVYLCWG